MSEKDDEEAPRTIPSLRDTGEDMTEEERRRQVQSPGEGFPAGEPRPYQGTADETTSPAKGTPSIGDEGQRKGQDTQPASDDDVGVPDDPGRPKD